MKFTATELKSIRTEMQKVLDNMNVGAEFSVGNISYQDGVATIKVTALKVGAGGETFDPLAEDFKRNAWILGLSPDDLGREFSTYSGTYKVVGMKPRNRKYPIIAENADGIRYKFPASVLKK